VIRGLVTVAALWLNLFFWGTAVILGGLVKVFLPGEPRRRLSLLLAELGDRWAGVNDQILDAMLPVRWDIEVPEGLRRDGHYLIFSNHVSWSDIIVIFRAFHRRIAFIRFFVKQQVMWLPILGQACWALECPFMRRYSADYLARHPEKRGRDLETTRRACERYRVIPVAILNFLEGTRFTYEKHAEQDSPFQHLLRPRAGGAAFVLASLGDQLEGVIDVTIAYDRNDITFWEFVTGRVRTVTVRARMLEVPEEFLTAAVVDPPLRPLFKAWIEGVWTEKDELLERLSRS
jgi:1-acyl-sn-glycerol-3-phosphate acyltransferase